MYADSNRFLKSSTSSRLLQAFVDGSAGGLIGGLIYLPLSSFFQIVGTQYSSTTIFALSFALGVFEMMRVAYPGIIGRSKACMLCFMAVAIILFLSMAETAALQTDAAPDKPQLLTNAAFTRSI